MFQIQYKELGRWVNVGKAYESIKEAQLVKNGVENAHSKVRIVKVED